MGVNMLSGTPTRASIGMPGGKRLMVSTVPVVSLVTTMSGRAWLSASQRWLTRRRCSCSSPPSQRSRAMR
jgi:hypothetical protein